MRLEILLSCMHQNDDSLILRSGLTGDVVVINQCHREDYREFPTTTGVAHMYSTCQRGLTRSRNMAIEKATADICMLCDDDEHFVSDYEERILRVYRSLPQADVIIFKMVNRPPSFLDCIMRLRFPQTMKVSSWQISFRRESLIKAGVQFDELLGAGTGNGAEEELKFLLDCERAGLAIYYVPVAVASVAQEASTWFSGFTEEFFENRGATTRYILGKEMASLYAIYYILRKKPLYSGQITPAAALRATFRGIRENKIEKQSQELRKVNTR